MSILTFPILKAPVSVEWWLETATQTFTSPLSRMVQTVSLPGTGRWRGSFSWRKLMVSDQRKLFAFLAKLNGQEGRFYMSDISLPTNQGSELGVPLVNGASAGSDGAYSTAVNLVGVDSGTRVINEAEYIKFSNHSTIYKVTASSMAGSPAVGNLTLHRNLTTAITDIETLEVVHTGNSLYTDGWTPNEAGVLIAGDYFNIGDEMYIITEDANADSSGGCILSIAPMIRTNFADNPPLDLVIKGAVMRLLDDKQAKMRIQAPLKTDFSIDFIESFT